MARTARSWMRVGLTVVIAAALLSLAAPARPADAAPACTAGVNRVTVWTSFIANRYVTAEFGYSGGLYGMVRADNTYAGPWESWTFCSWGRKTGRSPPSGTTTTACM